ncbi:MAG: aldehyde dehydrogenase family protein [Polyangiales bacterium]
MSASIQRTISPIDGSVVVERELAGEAAIRNALEAAERAQRDWARRPLRERMELCARMVDAFVAEKEGIASELTAMMGRPIRYAPNEVRGFEERARHMIAIAEEGLAVVKTAPKEGFVRYIRREPLGVVFVVAPWNYPYLTAVNAVVPAILAGNAVILKHSSQTPLAAERFAQAFERAGLPEGVFQYLHLSHDATAAVIEAPETRFVCFTGSVEGGRAVERAAAGRFLGLGLELGGKDPGYVRADADLAHAVDSLVDGAFFNSGQSCCGIERIYVHESLYDDFVERAVALTKTYVLGDPRDPETTLGPLVRTSAASFVRDQIAEAARMGATLHLDEKAFPRSALGTPYLAPQILTNVDHRMRVMSEESFGPVVGIMKVADDEEAVRLMNDSAYGLTACVYTRDLEAAERLGLSLETGTVFMNRCDYLDPALAWTGVKDSGRGCTLSVLGYEQLTRPKSFHLKLL